MACVDSVLLKALIDFVFINFADFREILYEVVLSHLGCCDVIISWIVNVIPFF